jgi:hypothetical protein
MKAIFNRHLSDFGGLCDFTIEFNVKSPNIPEGISEEHMQFEFETGYFANQYCGALREEFKNKFISDWSFAGRSNGWFVLMCNGSESSVRQSTLNKMERIVKKYYRNYGEALKTHLS